MTSRDNATDNGAERPLYQVMPDLDPPEYNALRDSIATQGCLESVKYDEAGNILDGHHRLRACRELGIPEADIPREIVAGLTEEQKVDYALTMNTARRHLTGEQRRELIRQRLAADPEKSDRQIATVLGVSHHTVAGVRAELEGRGQIAHVDTMTDSLGRTQPRQRRPVTVYNPSKRDAEALQDPDIVQRMADTGGNVASAIREQAREQLIQQLDSVEHREAQAVEGVFDVVVIDPPWPLRMIERDANPRAVEMPYPTMQLDEIRALQVPAADNAHIFLWTTQRFLFDAKDILDAWGFRYICTFVWYKGHNGYQPFDLPKYNCEFCLYAHNGTPKFIDQKDFYTCFPADPTGHSEKPEVFYDTLRRVTAGRRLDMFNRRPIEGFETWGKEAAD